MAVLIFTNDIHSKLGRVGMGEVWENEYIKNGHGTFIMSARDVSLS